jgi:hypothetical protein
MSDWEVSWEMVMIGSVVESFLPLDALERTLTEVVRWVREWNFLSVDFFSRAFLCCVSRLWRDWSDQRDLRIFSPTIGEAATAGAGTEG